MAAIKVQEPDKMLELQEKLRYFEVDGKPVRALKYDPSLLAANRDKLSEKTIFIKKLPKELSAKELHSKLEEKYGKIKSLKISLNKDYQSREYGFVTFEDPNIA